MHGKAAWTEWVATIIIAATILSVMGRLAEAAPPACPCWDIAAVRRVAPASEFPCQTKPEVAIQPGGIIRGAATQSLNSGQNFHLEAYVIEVKGQHQAWCKCFSNPPILGCAGDELKGFNRPEAQSCINEITRLCRDIRQK